jgi:hypothetical protein
MKKKKKCDEDEVCLFQGGQIKKLKITNFFSKSETNQKAYFFVK